MAYEQTAIGCHHAARSAQVECSHIGTAEKAAPQPEPREPRSTGDAVQEGQSVQRGHGQPATGAVFQKKIALADLMSSCPSLLSVSRFEDQIDIFQNQAARELPAKSGVGRRLAPLRQ